MKIANARNLAIQSTKTSQTTKTSSFNAYVYDVILDTNSEVLNSLDLPDFKSRYVGAILFRKQNDLNASSEKFEIALPDLNVKTLPLKNEVVQVTKNQKGQFFYNRIGFNVTPNVNSNKNSISKNFKKEQRGNSSKKDYSKVSQTNISRSNNDSSKNTDGYGTYFIENPNIHKLSFYEGDTLIESRFGQSLRFSAFNNNTQAFSPTIILRNGENPNTLNNEDLDVEGNSVVEDVNRDGSIFLMGSNSYRLPFQPGVIDENGNSNFQTNPDSFNDYPTDLVGHQILINSGRIIFSAKESEMIFYSKKNYGFISDGTLSIDNRLGIEVNVNDDINISTNDRDVNINTDNGSINLGSEDLQPLVKGEELVRVLTDLITAIKEQTFLTPSGPTSKGPTNLATFTKIENDLESILSSLNSTS